MARYYDLLVIVLVGLNTTWIVEIVIGVAADIARVGAS
jgi:hypothetical protein